MTLNEFANVDSFCRDLDNGNELVRTKAGKAILKNIQ